MRKQPLIVIVGPTASGKTTISIKLAKELNGEIISADSMQIYKGMSISTAKPTVDEMQGVEHHLIDFLEPNESFSVADYVKKAKETIKGIASRGKIPILVGGTGLYISSLIDNIKFDDTSSNPEIRSRLNELAVVKGKHYLWERLNEIDPETAKITHENNLSRVIRALEVFEITGETLTRQKELSRSEETPYNTVIIGLTFSDRDLLYKRINKRVDLMIEQGLVDEARNVYENNELKTAHQAIGYKELIPTFENSDSLKSCIDKIKQETRHYAKRQLTWFRRDERINWIELDKIDNILDLIEKVKIIIAKSKILCYNKD
ncbi:MAG: tRNA (adenosine(37)-N6)-dimethylallyltransferase MiaA [Clostridiales bacterium]|nr:tRNA (adenosine(37)-N6)-dimethylallyltransferase MiaA [Clostridiales bacterium]